MRAFAPVGGNPAVPEFEELYRAQRDRVVQLAWLLTRDTVVAEDIAHDAFAALFVVYERVENPVAYLRRSVVNGVYERSRRREREYRRNRLALAGAPAFTEGPTGGVFDAISQLPLDQRTVVVLRYWAGLNDAEIAQATGVRPGTARSRLSRASARLRKELI